VGVSKDSAGEAEGFVEPNGADEKGKGFCESYGVHWYLEEHGDWKSEDESEDRGREDGEWEPKVGSELSGSREEKDKGSVHEDVAEKDHHNVK
jgi:hypothetical protein